VGKFSTDTYGHVIPPEVNDPKPVSGYCSATVIVETAANQSKVKYARATARPTSCNRQGYSYQDIRTVFVYALANQRLPPNAVV
jgi:hypothetical protein